MFLAPAYAAFDSSSPLRPHTLERRDPGPRDVVIEILYCGVCHSDLHQVRNEWKMAAFPLVPGHEIAGRVSRVGAEVTKLQEGAWAGVGCLLDSCRTCERCTRGLEQYCAPGATWTYNGKEQDGITPTYGGYSTHIVVSEDFVLRLPAGKPLERLAPLLCAGITTYSPLKHWGAGKGKRVAVLGLGGLGHMAVKLAVAMGAEVTLLSSSPQKKEDALRLGAHEFALAAQPSALRKMAGRFDLVIDTVSAPHDLGKVLGTLRLDGTLVLLGIPDKPLEVPAFGLINGRRQVAGSFIGGIAETQEMLDFCAEHDVLADVEVIPVQDIDSAFERMLKGDVRYRFVIDTKTLRS